MNFRDFYRDAPVSWDAERALAHLAFPGDEDVTCDVDGLTLTAVICEGNEFLLRGVGGCGWWIDDDGKRFETDPGDETSRVEWFEAVFHMDDTPAKVVELYRGVLERWRDEAVLLRFVDAPGKFPTLVEDHKNWLPLPITR